MAWQRPAKGHIATVMLFDEETVFVPFNEKELNWLCNALRHVVEKLKDSGDFPEEQRYSDLMHNLHTATFLLSPMNTKKG